MAGELFIGLMSGTSVDGVDAALVEFQSSSELRVIETDFTSFDQGLRADINAIAQRSNDITRCEDSSLHDALAGIYARASRALLAKANISGSIISGIANHGQTIRHEPNASPPFSLQLGNPQLIANLSGIPCYARFRQADLSVGGQGAPLMPAFHSAVLGADKGSIVLNIGGIANITHLSDTVIGFDTGPGNTLMDQWIHKVSGQEFDRDGEWAASGTIIDALLTRCLSDEYFSLPAPKSTGPDYFNLSWLGDCLNYPAQDVQATLMALTVESIATAIRAQTSDSQAAIFVCGGGAANTTLMNHLQEALPSFNLCTTDQLGVPSDWVEAVGFAWLGYCCAHNIPSNLPSVTGAREAVVLGEKYLPQTP